SRSLVSLCPPPCLTCTPCASSPRSTLSLHDALPISPAIGEPSEQRRGTASGPPGDRVHRHVESAIARRAGVDLSRLGHLFSHFRSEAHTSGLQSRFDPVCRLLPEKKNKYNTALPSTQ